MPKLRHLLLAGAFVLTLAAALLDWPGQADTNTDTEALAAPKRARPAATIATGDTASSVASTGSRTSNPSATGTGTSQGAATPQVQRMRHTQANAFASQTWLPPAPKVKAAPPPTPHAPALPFVYLGRQQDGANVTVFVSQGTRNHVLHSGDTVAGYRVEQISPTDITFVYLALGEKQRLSFGSEN
jgi:hypothetical protein